jgi:N-acetylneuraminic acid mutarotase
MKKKRATLCLLLILCFVLSILSFPLVNATEDSWTTLEPMPTARSGFGVAVVDGKIYAIGGYNGSRLSTNEMYDPAADTWTIKKSMPTARNGPAIAVYQNKIYVIGGIINESDPVSSGYTGITEVYDPLTDTWETKEAMPTASSNLDANVVGDKIYLITGLTYGDVFPFQGYNDKNQVYDPSNDSWSTKTPIPSANWGYASAVVDNKIYVIGADHLTQIYDPETDTWASGIPSPTLVLSSVAAATTGVLAPKRIYVLGGNYDLNVAMNLTQVYDPETDTWTTGTPMPTPRWSLGVAVVNDELYAIGGYDGETYLAANEKYTPAGYIPEFPSWIVLPLFIVATLAVIAYRKKFHVVT